MRILIISQYYFPDITAAAFRIGEMADELIKRGHDVKVITSYPHRGKKGSIMNQKRDEENNIHRVKLSSFNHKGLINYISHYFSFSFKAIKEGVKIVFSQWRPQVIWTTSPPLFTGISGYVLSLLFRTPLVFDIRDIWPESAVAAGQISQGGTVFKLGKVLEKFLYQGSDYLTCVSEPMANYLRTRTDRAVSVVYNGINKNDLEENISLVKEDIILYAGNIGRVQGLEMLIEGFSEICKSEPRFNKWKFILIGDGVVKDDLELKIRQLQMQQAVILQGAIPKRQLRKEIQKARILVFNLQDDEVFKMTIPSKVFDYMAAGIPVVAGLLGEGKTILEKSGSNTLFYPDKKESFKQSLVNALENIDELEKKAQKNVEIVMSNYTRERATDALDEIFRQIDQENRK